MAKKSGKKNNAVQRAKSKKRKNTTRFAFSAMMAVAVLVGSIYYLGSTLQASTTKRSNDIIERLMQKQAQRKAKHEQEQAKKQIQVQKIEKVQKSKSKPAKVANRHSNKPKLILIIDDVSHASQIRAIKALGYHITPSIFPPSELSNRSNELSYTLKHFMIHLPMQSKSRQFNKMRGTLMTTDSDSRMKNRARQIRKLFPSGKYINNHTGSVFTSNYRAMKKMYGYLKDEGFVFMDSRTAGSTKLRRITKEYGDRYIVRDVFIDNKHSISYIHSQLRKAVSIAKKRGYCVAIGHPHKATIKALAKASKIFKDVELVYIDEVYP